ncbi:hypothetical protein [Xanthomonas citri]|uniref:hypothetical protein n=1 Tax=Xanthomonas citri TaxID=346 RepID=UPI001040753D|nr:hypothetical protein [Xanthomonas citri]
MNANNYKWLETPRTWALWMPPGGIPVYIRKSDAAVLIRWNGIHIRAKAASVNQAKRHVLRWIAARSSKPWGRGSKGGFGHRDALPASIRNSIADWNAKNGDLDF